MEILFLTIELVYMKKCGTSFSRNISIIYRDVGTIAVVFNMGYYYAGV
jgi:hypothetical protein